MLTTTEILWALDNCYENAHCTFITLSHPYIYLIDSRLNIFRDKFDKWAIAAEVLGYNPRGDVITLEIFYFGNCLTNLGAYDDSFGSYPVNYYNVLPVDSDTFDDTVDGEVLKPNAAFWFVRETPVPLSHNKQDYAAAGIDLRESELNEISVEDAARLAIIKYSDLFRATDDELYKSIPKDLEKILVLNEWYHKEYYQSKSPFANPKILSRFDLSVESVRTMINNEREKNNKSNLKEWNNNRPSSYETWHQIAAVLSFNDTSLYKPTVEPNSHWKNWPESGAL